MRAAFLFLLLVIPAAPAGAGIVSGAARVIDGDTLEIEGHRIRLYGIDAPELRQTCDRNGETWTCGEESGRQLAAIIGDQRVDCEGDENDSYGRLVAVCSAGYTQLNRTMVESGWATAFRKYSQDYVADEIRARGERRGLWKSTFELPETYRIARSGAASASPDTPATQSASDASAHTGGCLIKGNRSRRGEWIYHLPDQPYYAETRAEEMFCSEVQAQAAGYRRSRATW